MNIVWKGQFKKDYKRAKKQGKNLADLRSVIEMLAGREPLPPKHRDHTLCGQWNKHRECHIARETLIKTTVFQRTGDGFEQKKYEKVKIVAFNPFVDLALLKIEDAEREFPYVYLGDMSRVAVGETVFAIGNPLGLTRSVSQGIVSTTNRDFEGQLYIQTTTDMNPGNSGGPLFNLAGEVIGVTSMGYLFYGGLNFAIPVDTVKRFLENCDAFAYSEDNPNAGYRYLQPGSRKNRAGPPAAKRPEIP